MQITSLDIFVGCWWFFILKFLCWNQSIHRNRSQYHDYWWSGSQRLLDQAVSGHGIDYAGWTSACHLCLNHVIFVLHSPEKWCQIQIRFVLPEMNSVRQVLTFHHPPDKSFSWELRSYIFNILYWINILPPNTSQYPQAETNKVTISSATL